jgi:hypothetical protein
MKWLGKTKKHLSQDSRPPGRDSNPGTLEHNSSDNQSIYMFSVAAKLRLCLTKYRVMKAYWGVEV